jgi:hypothetical protein
VQFTAEKTDKQGKDQEKRFGDDGKSSVSGYTPVLFALPVVPASRSETVFSPFCVAVS